MKPKRLVTVHKRLGKTPSERISQNATDLLKSIFSNGAIKNEPTDTNPFRTTRDHGVDETLVTAVKVKSEVPSPSRSTNGEDALKRKHTDDDESECKKQKLSQDENMGTVLERIES